MKVSLHFARCSFQPLLTRSSVSSDLFQKLASYIFFVSAAFVACQEAGPGQAAVGDPAEDPAEERVATITMNVNIHDSDGAEPRPVAKATAYVDAGEDSAVGAFRWAEEQQVFDIGTVREVHKKLEEAVPDSYKVPEELTVCGKRTCTAAKHAKRAEEARKAGIYDDAGADLLRALTKKGIDADFLRKCEASLAKNFQLVGSQRRREMREAEEERKLEARRLEEEEAMKAAKKRKEEYESGFERFIETLRSKDRESRTGDFADVGVGGESSTSGASIDLVLEAFIAGNCTDALASARAIPMRDKTQEVMLVEARCQELLGNTRSALTAAGALVQKTAKHEAWEVGSPRMLAVSLP